MTHDELIFVTRSTIDSIETITGLPSRWSGELHFTNDLDFDLAPVFVARKDWRCSISLHQSLLDSPQIVVSIIHEGFHSVSSGVTPFTVDQVRGLEEGVVEALTRRF